MFRIAPCPARLRCCSGRRSAVGSPCRGVTEPSAGGGRPGCGAGGGGRVSRRSDPRVRGGRGVGRTADGAALSMGRLNVILFHNAPPPPQKKEECTKEEVRGDLITYIKNPLGGAEPIPAVSTAMLLPPPPLCTRGAGGNACPLRHPQSHPARPNVPAVPPAARVPRRCSQGGGSTSRCCLGGGGGGTGAHQGGCFGPF